jgi:WD40 repeat protein
MRSICVLCLVSLSAFAAAPPAPVPAEWLKLIEQLGDDGAVRNEAENKLVTIGEDAVPVLRRAGKTHADVDVRLRVMVVLASIEKKLYGEVRAFKGHTDGVLVFALSPDGKKMVSGAWHRQTDHVARVWEVETGKELIQLTGHKGSVGGVAWSKDGKRILTGSDDGRLMLWDAAHGKHLKTYVNEGGCWYVALSSDGKKAVSCGRHRTIMIWDLESGKVTASNSDVSVNVAVRCVTMLPNGKQFAATSFDGAVRVLDLETGKLVRQMDGAHRADNGAQFVAVSPDGKRLASCGGDGMVRLHDVETGKQLMEFSGHTDLVHGIAFSSDGKRLASCSWDRTVRIWDVASGKAVQTFDDAHADVITCVAFLPGDGRVVTSGYDKLLKVWKIRK